jgi:hypothetical protein
VTSEDIDQFLPLGDRQRPLANVTVENAIYFDKRPGRRANARALGESVSSPPSHLARSRNTSRRMPNPGTF